MGPDSVPGGSRGAHVRFLDRATAPLDLRGTFPANSSHVLGAPVQAHA